MSLDGDEKHSAFASQYALPYPLLSDSEAAIAKAFGVARLGGWLPTKRVTFVIDRDGIVRHVIKSELGIDKHIEEAIGALGKLAKQ